MNVIRLNNTTINKLKKALKICIIGDDYCHNCPYRQPLEEQFLDDEDACVNKLYKDVVQLIEQK